MMHDDAKSRLMQMIMQQFFSASDDAKKDKLMLMVMH